MTRTSPTNLREAIEWFRRRPFVNIVVKSFGIVSVKEGRFNRFENGRLLFNSVSMKRTVMSIDLRPYVDLEVGIVFFDDAVNFIRGSQIISVEYERK